MDNEHNKKFDKECEEVAEEIYDYIEEADNDGLW